MDITVEQIVPVLVSGLTMAGTFAMMSVGLTLQVGVLRVMNFGHGALLMIVMYGTYWFFNLLHIDPLLSLAIMVPRGCTNTPRLVSPVSLSSLANT